MLGVRGIRWPSSFPAERYRNHWHIVVTLIKILCQQRKGCGRREHTPAFAQVIARVTAEKDCLRRLCRLLHKPVAAYPPHKRGTATPCCAGIG